MASEIELKLAIAAGDFRRVAALPALPALAAAKSGRPRKALLAATYYDTPDNTLQKAGITARVRSDGSVHTQTVKTAGTRVAGLFARGEWEERLASPEPDTALLRATALPLLQNAEILAALRPLFTTQVNRTTRRLSGPGWEAELALDQGFIQAGDARQDIAEVELELSAGEPSHLFALARAIVEAVPARLLTVSKSDRGYELAAGAIPKPVKSSPVELTATTPAGDAFAAIAGNCLHQVLANERCLLATGDPEAIHQMRVALRRLRSAIKVFKPVVAGPQLETARQEIKWLLEHLGPARDSHVFVSEIVAPVAEQSDTAMAALTGYWQEVAALDHQRAVEAVGSRRFTALLLDLGAWAAAGDWRGADRPGRDEMLAPLAARVLRKCHKRLRKAGGKTLTKLAPEELHQVRILGKQVRYAGEFFASLYPGKATTNFLGTVAELQDLLGGLNDIAVAAKRLDSLKSHTELAWPAGVLNGWHQSRRPALLKDAAHVWKTFLKSKPFWR